MALTCKVSGFPLPRIIWRKDGVLLGGIEKDTRFSISEEHPTESMVLIASFDSVHIGTYECLAIGSGIVDTQAVDLGIQGEK